MIIKKDSLSLMSVKKNSKEWTIMIYNRFHVIQCSSKASVSRPHRISGRYVIPPRNASRYDTTNAINRGTHVCIVRVPSCTYYHLNEQ